MDDAAQGVTVEADTGKHNEEDVWIKAYDTGNDDHENQDGLTHSFQVGHAGSFDRT